MLSLDSSCSSSTPGEKSIDNINQPPYSSKVENIVMIMHGRGLACFRGKGGTYSIPGPACQGGRMGERWAQEGEKVSTNLQSWARDIFSASPRHNMTVVLADYRQDCRSSVINTGTADHTLVLE